MFEFLAALVEALGLKGSLLGLADADFLVGLLTFSLYAEEFEFYLWFLGLVNY